MYIVILVQIDKTSGASTRYTIRAKVLDRSQEGDPASHFLL